MITIYHNPRCRKSREALEHLNGLNKPFEVREYLKNPPDRQEIIELLKKLGIKAEDLVRKKEAIFKEKYKDHVSSEDDYIEALVQDPVLIERPLVIREKDAFIARTPESLGKIS
ncbi:MAG: ArsC/Spx/MgsR family protein [Cytophagaceae bacterium]